LQNKRKIDVIVLMERRNEENQKTRGKKQGEKRKREEQLKTISE
jgi:hypothetical protein